MNKHLLSVSCTHTHTFIPRYVFITFCNLSREAGNNVQYIWSYYSAAELKKMMDAFDAWEGKGTVQFFYFMAEGDVSLVRQSQFRYAFLFLRKHFFVWV